METINTYNLNSYNFHSLEYSQSSNNINISEYDFIRLKKLLQYYPNEELERELARAELINCITVPEDLVTMESTILYHLETDDIKRESTLVFPHCPEEQTVCISVLNPLGTALLGLSVGQSIEWDLPEGRKLLRVLDVIYQPEAQGRHHPLSFE